MSCVREPTVPEGVASDETSANAGKQGHSVLRYRMWRVSRHPRDRKSEFLCDLKIHVVEPCTSEGEMPDPQIS